MDIIDFNQVIITPTELDRLITVAEEVINSNYILHLYFGGKFWRCEGIVYLHEANKFYAHLEKQMHENQWDKLLLIPPPKEPEFLPGTKTIKPGTSIPWSIWTQVISNKTNAINASS